MIIVIFVLVSVLVLATYVTLRLLKVRKDATTKKAIEKRSMSRYPYLPSSTSEKMIVETYRDILHDLGVKGLEKPPGMTPDEFERAVLDSSGGFEGMEPLTRLFEEARYSDHDISSHLIGKAKEMKHSIERFLQTADTAQLESGFKRSIEGSVQKVHTDLVWRMRMDPTGELKKLLGDKEVDE